MSEGLWDGVEDEREFCLELYWLRISICLLLLLSICWELGVSEHIEQRGEGWARTTAVDTGHIIHIGCC